MKIQSKYFVALFLVIWMMLTLGQATLAAPADQQVQFVAPRLVVNSSFLNVRAGPGIQYPVLITVVGGSELPVLARASDNVWFQVSTVIGVGWVNVQYTVPRGNFDRVPIVRLSDVLVSLPVVSVPTTLGLPLGQGGGVPAPVTTTIVQVPVVPATTTITTTAPSAGGIIRIDLGNGRFTSVAPGERFRAVIAVEAVNLLSQPQDGAPALGTLFRDDTRDYPIVGSVKDKRGFDWLAIDVVELGTGWLEAPKVTIRLSRVAGQVVQVSAATIGLTDVPNGSGRNLPVLASGREAFLVGLSRDGKFIQLELGDGTRGWAPFGTVVDRTGTPTDGIDVSQLPSLARTPITVPANTVVIPSTTVITSAAAVQTMGLDTPHVVINTGFLNIRSGPGAQFSVVTTVPGGTQLPVLGMAKDRVWFLVQGAFGRGWVNSEFAIFRGSIQSVPIIQEAAITGVLSTPVAITSAPITLYAAPGTNFGAIGTLSAPLELPVVARTADGQWLQLNTSLGFGWVLANQVLVRGDISLIPIVG